MTSRRLIFSRTIARPLPWARLMRPSSLAARLEDAGESRAAWDRVGSLLKMGGLLVALVGVVLAVNAFGRMPRPAPIELTHTVSLSEFGLQVVFPSTWKVESGQGGADFVANHSETGARLVGAVTLSDPPAPDLDSRIDWIIEEQRARLGNVANIARGVMGVGLLEARWLKLSFLRQGEMVRMRTVAVQRGLSTLTLTCSGGLAAQKACDAAIRTVTMAR